VQDDRGQGQGVTASSIDDEADVSVGLLGSALFASL
jgi:hypothetical protein